MKPNRREFLATAGASAVTAAPQHFRATSAPRKLLDNVWLFEDTANVYIVRNGANAVLIDFGSGGVLDHLPALGITKIDWILHTHHHRDQCQGDHKAVARRIPIAVPAHERHLFEDAENFWRNRRVFHLYYMRNDFNTVTRNIPVERALADYTTFRWGNVEFFVHPAPGHTPGSIALVAQIGGKRVAFTGDLLYAPGRIQNLYDTQIAYGGWEGVDLASYSLARLREQGPELLCPSHGEPMADADAAIQETVRRLAAYQRFQGGEPVIAHKPLPVSPHLVAHHLPVASFYAIVSDSGKAMFVDYGAASYNHFNTFEKATGVSDRMRFVEHSVDELKRSYGVKSIDVAMPSHTHDDHINGFPHLKRRYGTRVWCYENMADILQNPRGYNLGCILGEAFQVDRTFRHGERFKWEEFEFEVTHSPGHSEHQMALYATIDGRRIAFTGDAFFEGGRDGAMRHNLIFRNHVESDSHVKSIRNLIEHEPEMICPGHGKPFAVTRPLMDATLTRLTKQQEFFRDMLPEGETNFGLDPSWVSLYPYQLLIAPGARQSVEVRVRNYKPEAMKVEVALVAPAQWRITPAVQAFEAPGGGTATRVFDVAVPRAWEPPSPRFAIAADVMADGRYLGQITEAVVEIARRA
ncbi:MAG TPA: MBL fold metallo-hydrolase [Bryobacteraceae bacterium]|nr:MBL fold metallo-hydrolase [Bryobacteraceae bacterium]